MDRAIAHNRWFIWTIVILLVIGTLTFSYIEWSKGEIDSQVSAEVVY